MLYTIVGQQRHLEGWKKDTFNSKDSKISINVGTLPSAVDLEALCCPILDQGHIGSCVVNSASAMAQFVHRHYGMPYAPLSRLDWYRGVRLMEGTPVTEDSGAQVRSAMDYYFHTGVCLESTWGYDTSKFADEPPPEAVAQRAQHKALFHYGCPDLDTLKHSLAQGFPVQFGFEVYRSMMNASKGDVPYPVGDTQIGGHAVLAVGYDDNYKIGFEKGAVKFQNSWGDAWGVRGFGYLPYRYFVEDMASDFRTLRKETP